MKKIKKDLIPSFLSIMTNFDNFVEKFVKLNYFTCNSLVFHRKKVAVLKGLLSLWRFFKDFFRSKCTFKQVPFRE